MKTGNWELYTLMVLDACMWIGCWRHWEVGSCPGDAAPASTSSTPYCSTYGPADAALKQKRPETGQLLMRLPVSLCLTQYLKVFPWELDLAVKIFPVLLINSNPLVKKIPDSNTARHLCSQLRIRSHFSPI